MKSNLDWFFQIWHWHETLGNSEQPFLIPGICDICVKPTNFNAVPTRQSESAPFPARVSWWGLRCGCEMSTLDRVSMHILLDGARRSDRIYHVGNYSLFLRRLKERMPDVVSSQFEQGRLPGEMVGDVQYEDLTRLSFADGEFQAVICMEVLEHLPVYEPALRELARVLKPGGRAVLTFPWLGGEHYEHLIRAEMLPNGTIKHHLPPEYHGDPACAERILSFRAFGWKILDELRAAGFAQASAEYLFGPLHGYVSLGNPVIVAVA